MNLERSQSEIILVGEVVNGHSLLILRGASRVVCSDCLTNPGEECVPHQGRSVPALV